MNNDIWEGAEVVSFYDDSQAIEDGVIVDISELGLDFRGRPLNRMTRGLWEDFQPFITLENSFSGDAGYSADGEAQKDHAHEVPARKARGWHLETPAGIVADRERSERMDSDEA